MKTQALEPSRVHDFDQATSVIADLLELEQAEGGSHCARCQAGKIVRQALASFGVPLSELPHAHEWHLAAA